ncbi:MAG: hypothetical protein IJ180_09595 [Bacteroidales bacterium]|nr:hypothetical protein [Bacteroidales bacterium]
MYLNFATGYKLPPYWLSHPQVVKQINDEGLSKDGLLGVACSCPLKIKTEDESEWWQIPIEPVVSITCKNIIVRRNILKAGVRDVTRRGTVKELWTQDDYQVSISGLLIGEDDEALPESDLIRLKNMCEHRGVLEVESKLFTIFNITRIAVESYEFPFTKGMNNQMYTIKGYSDDFDVEQLLVEK